MAYLNKSSFGLDDDLDGLESDCMLGSDSVVSYNRAKRTFVFAFSALLMISS